MVSGAATSVWAGWEFQSSINPITNRGADHAHHTTARPPGFENPAASLVSIQERFLIKIGL